MTPESYTDNFFSFHLQNSLSSAAKVIPLVMKYTQPTSVIDIGCGVGTWLKVWKDNGITDIAGVDGDYVDRKELLISEAEFTPFDLATGYTTNKKFALASSLEVAEHINPASAQVFVDALCRLSDVVLFSAAIPGQEGTLHINEQYPQYWVERFAKNGYLPADCLRKQIWDDKDIAWWYRQNILFFVKKTSLNNYPALVTEVTEGKILPLVHPELLAYKDARISNYERTLGNPFRTAGHFAKKSYRSIKKIFKR